MYDGYRITSPYGMRTHPITGKRNTFHTGIDLAKYHKAPIYPFVPGMVIFATMGVRGSGYGGFGNTVVIRDQYNHNHMYSHLHDYRVKPGDTVGTDQIIGRQGATGNVTGSHLHYEVRKGGFGTHIDPTAYLKQYFEKEEDEVQTCRVMLDNKLIGEGVLHDGQSYLPVRALENITYTIQRWDSSAKTIYLKTVPSESTSTPLPKAKILLDFRKLAEGYIIDGKTHAPIASLEGIKFNIARWDERTRTAFLRSER